MKLIEKFKILLILFSNSLKCYLRTLDMFIHQQAVFALLMNELGFENSTEASIFATGLIMSSASSTDTRGQSLFLT